MDREALERLLQAYDKKSIGREELLHLLLSGGFTDMEHSKVDTSRYYRLGFPEVVYCRNKGSAQILDITGELYRKNGFVLLTRASAEQYAALRGPFPDSQYHEKAGVILVGKGMEKRGLVSCVSAGTSDLPVAEEAALTAEAFGCAVKRVYDAGVAGLHRLMACRDEIAPSNAIVAVAGMEGALPSVVGGLFGAPVIGVPTSVGYGANLGGLAPLLTMLNSCAPGVCVVNIDNGFGAGYLASLINRMVEDSRGEGTS
jgi:NCAIR mutase (PurE)-related protein